MSRRNHWRAMARGRRRYEAKQRFHRRRMRLLQATVDLFLEAYTAGFAASADPGEELVVTNGPVIL